MDSKINPKFPNHIIYEDGRIYSLRLNRFMKPDMNSSNYIRYSIRGNNKKVFAHHLVMDTFGSVPPSNMVNPTIDHIDGNKHNNHINNLRWLPKKTNTGRHNPRKVSLDKIQQIRELYNTGKYSYRQIARKLDIGCHKTIKRLLN
ncbi:MAG: hypothetical protein EBZ49_04485 [Proteobacteria bacterium]|nr:hypothetical protein [Pseudomonadota bacterium]